MSATCVILATFHRTKIAYFTWGYPNAISCLWKAVVLELLLVLLLLFSITNELVYGLFTTSEKVFTAPQIASAKDICLGFLVN